MRPHTKALPRYLRIFAGKAIWPVCFMDYQISRIRAWVWPERYAGSEKVHLNHPFLNGSVLLIACYLQNSDDVARLQSLCAEMIEEVTVFVINTGSVKADIDSRIRCLNRPNYGRDLYSFAIGVNMLRNAPLDHLLLINDSIYWEKGALLDFWLKAKEMKSDVVSMTDSFQGSYHLQSFVFCINNPSREVLAPFSKLKPSYMKRTLVEFGEKRLSKLWVGAGIQIEPLWKTDCLVSDLPRYKEIYRDDYKKIELLVKKSIPLNPSIHMWPILFSKAGVLKKSLTLRNPAKLENFPKSLSHCHSMVKENQKFLKHLQ